MKVKLIAPAMVGENKRGMQGQVFQVPPLFLAAVAAATPDQINVKIIDRSIEPVNYNVDADLIGITYLRCGGNSTVLMRFYYVS